MDFDLGSIAGSALGAAGSIIGGSMASSNAKDQIRFQREFAQNGIRWRVADAKAAGIHPLAALGAQLTGYTPVTVGDGGVSSALQQMGQGIDRAVSAKQAREERAAEFAFTNAVRNAEIALKNKQVQAMDAEIEATRINTALALRRAMLPPALPGKKQGKYLPGQDDGVFQTLANSGASQPMFQLMHDTRGRSQLLPTDDYSQLMEDKIGLEWWPYINSWIEAMTGMPDHVWTNDFGWITKQKARALAGSRRAKYEIETRKVPRPKLPSWYYSSPGF